MAVRSRDFVGIAEGIRSHELSTKSQIENLKGRMSELSGRRSSLNSTISYLEAAIAAAYEDTDEDGDPDYGLIASLEAQKSSAENELSGVENDLDSTGNELENKQNELETVEEEKAQTLFEIQERARKTSNNISLAGGMYGAYAGVGGTLQNSLQTSLSSLTQAAGILGGSVDGASGGSLGGPSGSGNAASGEVGSSLGDNGSGTGPLSAFTGGYSGEALPLSASQFSTNQDQLSTPATMPNYHSGQGSINTRAPQSFSTEQGANEYALSSFGDVTAPQVTSQSADGYRSNQASQNMESQFVPTDSSAPGASSSSPGSRQHSFADWLNPDNYTEDGHYIGEGQLWGYKPYGNDTSEYAATIMTPEQQAVNAYMQDHNYGKWDFGEYSKDPVWKKLNKTASPTSVKKDNKSPQDRLTEYMYEHNYGWDDYLTYSRDPEWQRISRAIRLSTSAPQPKQSSTAIHYMKLSEDIYTVGEKTHRDANTFFEKIFEKVKTKASTYKTIPLTKRYALLQNTNTENISSESLHALTSLSADILKKSFGNVFSSSRFKEIEKNIIILSKDEIEKHYPNVRSDVAGFYCSETREIVVKKGAKIPIGRFLHTHIHEMLHKLSHGDGEVGLLETYSYKGEKIIKHTGLNEGITDLYACRAMESVMPEYFAQGYPLEISIVERIESIYGKKELLDVFANGKIDELRKDFDFCFGERGKFDAFSELVDDINLLTSVGGKSQSAPAVSRKISEVFKMLNEYEKLKSDSNYRFRKHHVTKTDMNTPTTLSNSPKNEAPKKDPRELAVWERGER